MVNLDRTRACNLRKHMKNLNRNLRRMGYIFPGPRKGNGKSFLGAWGLTKRTSCQFQMPGWGPLPVIHSGSFLSSFVNSTLETACSPSISQDHQPSTTKSRPTEMNMITVEEIRWTIITAKAAGEPYTHRQGTQNRSHHNPSSCSLRGRYTRIRGRVMERPLETFAGLLWIRSMLPLASMSWGWNIGAAIASPTGAIHGV